MTNVLWFWAGWAYTEFFYTVKRRLSLHPDLHSYQIILLGNGSIRVWTTFPKLLRRSAWPGIEPTASIDRKVASWHTQPHINRFAACKGTAGVQQCNDAAWETASAKRSKHCQWRMFLFIVNNQSKPTTRAKVQKYSYRWSHLSDAT